MWRGGNDYKPISMFEYLMKHSDVNSYRYICISVCVYICVDIHMFYRLSKEIKHFEAGKL